MADNFKPCAVEGCNGNAHSKASGARGWCLKHYRKWQKYGDPNAGREYSPGKICSVESCERPAQSRGWCRLHYKRWKRNGDPRKRVVSENLPGQVCAVKWCNRASKKIGLCETHYAHTRANPDKKLSEIRPRDLCEVWISDHVNWSGEDCLLWPFSRMESGYGQGAWGGVRMVASRAMCIAAHGEPPSKKHEAAHSCGKGREGCVNPRHLYWATRSQNQMDRVQHGTSNRGERHGMAKLNAVDVIGIRQMEGVMSHRAISEYFGVSKSHVSKLIKRESWSWLE